MTKILYLDWNSFAGEFMKTAWEKAGISVVVFPFDFNKEKDRKNTRMDSELTQALVMAIMSDSFDAVFSFNYFPIAAMAAKACRVRYISWVYDSPYAQLYSHTINFQTNDIRIFDKAEVINLKNKGVKTVSYLPLASATDYYDALLEKSLNDEMKYTSDISFVGAMYTESKHQLYKKIEKLPLYEKGMLDGMIELQKHIYGQGILETVLNDNISLVNEIEKVSPVYLHPDGFETKEWVYANYYLYRQVTAKERTEIMNLLAENGYGLKIYTNKSENDGDDNVYLSAKARNLIQGKVDYYKEAPYVFRNSKINLNISLRSIGSGIPLRAFDIMGCGGFLLTNYQSDLLELFEPDKDFVYYTSYQDLIQKIDYYLSHETERKKIAINGYEKVKKHHTFMHRVQDLQRKSVAFPWVPD